jgi:hydrogenase expression/formation protein HypC
VCLAVPARLVECESAAAQAVADLHGNRVQVSTSLVPDARAGDWVLVHAGFAIQKLDGDDVRETWAVLEDLRGKAGAT